MEKTLKNGAGFTIVEIFVAMLIIFATTFVIMAFMRNTLVVTKDTRGRDAALLAAEDKISELALKPFPGADNSDQVAIDNIVFTRAWAIKDTGYIRRAIVTVTYKSFNGVNRRITLAGAIH